MNDGIIKEDRLREITGYKQRAAIKRWLIEKRIGFEQGKLGQIFTTQAALDARLLGTQDKEAKVEIL